MRQSLQKQHFDASEKRDNARLVMQDYRLKISTKETELLLVFRELIAWDFLVDDIYFENLRATQLKKETAETFNIDISTFWKPVELEARYIEKDL